MLSAVKFMVVDDQPYTREIVSTILKAADVSQIHYASDGAQAIERLSMVRPDILITDQLMGGMDGLDLVRVIRRDESSFNPFLPIIMLTGRTEMGFVAQARDAGVSEFASKPITAQNLLSRINAVIMRPRPFVRKEDFFGPDRRRRADAALAARARRAMDQPFALD